MSAPIVQAVPPVPPRPSRSPDKESSASNSSGVIPKIPPRPARNKRLERSMSPSCDRFAPSPLIGGILTKDDKPALLSPNHALHHPTHDPIERAGSVELPSVGEEGNEYSAVSQELEEDKGNEKLKSEASPPGQTRTIAEDLQLHAPKPSLPASSAKQRVMAVTRTDSDRAASFGIGKTHKQERAASREGFRQRPSTSASVSSDHGYQTDEDHGIPEIGQRVPMNPHLGDVQAPSPAPSEGTKHHSRKKSSRSLPPGSYGLHGHGTAPQDKLEKAYYQKHPELLKREEHTPIHDRQVDFAMSSNDLNRLVRDTVSREAGFGELIKLVIL